eukprot:gene6726-8342_t
MKLILVLIAIIGLVSGIKAFECEMCQFSYNVIGDLVEQNTTITEILPIVLSACNFQSSELSVTCQEIAKAHSYEMIFSTIDANSAIDACTQLGKCPVSTSQLGKHHHWDPIKKIKCSACHHIVKSMAHSINKSADEAANDAKKECRTLGGVLSHECEKLVGSIYRRVYDELKRHESENNICKHVHMC